MRHNVPDAPGTARFKSKLFSFAHIVVDENELTLYQISEPLGNTSSASAQHPAPFGTDYGGRPLNDPIPDTVFDPVTRTVVSPPATGMPALLDKVKVTKPDISADVRVELGAPKHVKPGDSIELSFEFRNRSAYAMNGTQVVMALPDGISFDFASEGTTTLHGHDVVVSLGRTLPGQAIELEIHGRVSSTLKRGTHLAIGGLLRSSTALPVAARTVTTTIGQSEDDDGSEQGPRR